MRVRQNIVGCRNRKPKRILQLVTFEIQHISIAQNKKAISPSTISISACTQSALENYKNTLK